MQASAVQERFQAAVVDFQGVPHSHQHSEAVDAIFTLGMACRCFQGNVVAILGKAKAYFS